MSNALTKVQRPLDLTSAGRKEAEAVKEAPLVLR